MSMKPSILYVFLGLIVCAIPASGQDSPVHWSAKPPAQPIEAGMLFEVELDADIEGQWHMYSATQPPGGPVATSFKIQENAPFEMAGNLKQSPPKTEFDANFGIPTEFFAGSAEFWIPLKSKAGARPGDYQVEIRATYQLCDDKSCLPPRDETLSFKVRVIAGEGAASELVAAAATAIPTETAAEVDRAKENGFLPFLWLSMTMGALSLATPCVFPMIPITVSYFTKKVESGRSSGLHLAWVYCLGIILTFTGLGLGMTALLGATGIHQFAANPWMNLLITAVFLGFALNLFGCYPIGIPSRVLTKLSAASSGPGYASTLLMGLTFTLTSFTCTVPFIGTVLVATAQGDWLWPAMGMLGFSLVFAAPFFLLALLPRAMAALPKSGDWLHSVKVIMGFLEVAAAMKFLSNADLVWQWRIFSRPVVLSIWIAVAVAAAAYLLGKLRLRQNRILDFQNVLRVTCATVFLAVGFYLFAGLLGRSLGEIDAFLPPRTAGAYTLTGGSHGAELRWNTNLETALAQARQERKLVFVDFTGYTCTNCRWMESNIFALQEVQSALKKYVRLQLFTDGEGQQYKDNQTYQKDRFGTVALPLYAILDARGNKLSTFAGMTRNAVEFVRFLDGPLSSTSPETSFEK
jgi:thiol:disulfide interchange protein DsbD